MIRFQSLSLGYGSRILIDSLSATVKRGELTALVGRNGTGKSTLLRAITGLGERKGGDILLGDKSIDSLSTAELATMVAFVTTDKVRIANLDGIDNESGPTKSFLPVLDTKIGLDHGSPVIDCLIHNGKDLLALLQADAVDVV